MGFHSHAHTEQLEEVPHFLRNPSRAADFEIPVVLQGLTPILFRV